MNPFVLSLYIGYALYTVFPFLTPILGNNTPAARTIISLIIYAIFVGISTYLFNRLGFSSRNRKNWHAIVLTVLSVGFILALGYHIFAIDRLITLPPAITVFFTNTYFFWWFIAPIVGLFLLAL